MTGIERIEQRPRLDTAHLTKDDPVRSPAESGLEKIVESDVGFERIGLTLDGKHVRLLDMQFGGVFDNDDALFLWDRVRQNAEDSRLSGRGSAADKHGLSVANLFGKKIRERLRQRAASDKVIDRVMAAGKLPNDECGRRPHDRRNDCRETASIWELGVQDGVVFVQVFAELVGDNFEAGAELAG